MRSASGCIASSLRRPSRYGPGNTFVARLASGSGNGAEQVADLDKTRAMRGAPLFIDLDGANRRISKVVVYGKGGRRAAINVLAT